METTQVSSEAQEAYMEPDLAYSERDDEFDAPYRSVSKAAVLSLAFAIASILGLLFPALLLFTFFAILAGIVGLKNLRRYPEELTGKKSAVLGLVGGIVMLAAGSTLHTYIYLTEVPPGYERISFGQLQPNDDNALAAGAPELPTDLDGKQIFVKGYMHPGVAELGAIKKFILVPDMGTCCFGGQPKLTDMIEVTVKDGRGLQYNRRKRKLAGEFHVSYRLKQVAGGLNGGYYSLDAHYAR